MRGDLTLYLADDTATAVFGALVAHYLAPGDVVSLAGELGAGKTALARAIIRSKSEDETLDVPSPSFALVQPYEAGAQQIIHADLYRLSDAVEIEELGLLDDPDAMVLVEWAERAPELLARATLAITLSVGAGGEGRDVRLESPDIERLGALMAAAEKQGIPLA